MGSTSESEIISKLEEADEKMKLRLRETADMYRGVPACEKNCELLSGARTSIQAAITALLRVKW